MEALRKPEPLSFEGNVAENWKNFEAEFDIFVQAAYGDRDQRTKAYILLNLAGREAIEKEKIFTYAAEVRNDAGDVVQPAESRENLTVLKAKFTELCNPLTNVIIEQHKFNSRVQQLSEHVQNFITSLKILSNSCEYGSLKDSLIRDRIVCGVSSDTLRRQLLKERELTFHRAIQMCQIHRGHKFTEEGLQPDPEKTDAVRKMPPPEGRAALLRFLAMMNCLSKFIKNYSEKTAVLRELLHNDVT